MLSANDETSFEDVEATLFKEAVAKKYASYFTSTLHHNTGYFIQVRARAKWNMKKECPTHITIPTFPKDVKMANEALKTSHSLFPTPENVKGDASLNFGTFSVLYLRGAQLCDRRGQHLLHGCLPRGPVPEVRLPGDEVLLALAQRAQGPAQPHVHRLPHYHQVRVC